MYVNGCVSFVSLSVSLFKDEKEREIEGGRCECVSVFTKYCVIVVGRGASWRGCCNCKARWV